MARNRLPGDPSRGMARFILICFFISGLTGLIYEVLWTRMIVKIIGGAPFAVSIVLTVFMAGLGVGSFLAGRTVDRVREPLRLVRLYGLLELSVAGYCLVLPLLLMAFKPLYAVLYNRLFDHFLIYSILTFIGCGLLLIVPVICMGATLPILSRFFVTHLAHLGTRTGRLYGLNTLGAATGTLLTGFLLIENLGTTGTLALAVALNGLIGLSCVALGRRAVEHRAGAERDKHKPHAAVPADVAGAALPRTVSAALIVFAVSGFCAMAYEVIWTRLLGLIVGPTTYSFTLVLVTFITCLALGSMLFGWLADRVAQPIRLLVWTQFAAGLLALLVSHVLGNSQLFFAKLLYHFHSHFALLSVGKALCLFAFMFPPTLLLGATFPLVGKIFTQSVSRIGRSVGVAYSINTVGAVLGSFCAGFILIPFLGKEKGLSLVVALQIATSLGVGVMVLWRGRGAFWKLIPLTALTVLGLALCLRYPLWDRLLLTMGRYQRFSDMGAVLERTGWWKSLFHGTNILGASKRTELVYYGDGVAGFTTVLKDIPAAGLSAPAYSLVNSGKADASSYGDMDTQTLLAHFPMLFHKRASQVMVLGLGSGITAGEVLLYPVERMDVLEISPQVVEASRWFRPWNNNVLADPRTHLIVQDGRAHLELTDRTYDVVISEPSNPWMAGLATLFTQEYFTLVRNRLNDDGIFVQWFHTYSMDWSTYALVGRTFARVFPNSALVVTNPFDTGTDCLLVGFKGKDRLVLDNARRNAVYAQKSQIIQLPNPEVLLPLITSEDLPRLFGAGPVNTDSQPRLEYAAPRLLYTVDAEDRTIAANVRKRAWVRPDLTQRSRQILSDVAGQLDLATYAFSVHWMYPNMVNLSQATAAQRERFGRLAEEFAARNPIDFRMLGDRDIEQRCRLAQIRGLQGRMKDIEDRAGAHLRLAELYAELGMIAESVASYRKALELDPDSPEALCGLAWRLAIHRQADFFNPRQAIACAQRANQQVQDQSARALDILAAAYAAAGQYDQAREAARQALAVCAATHQTEWADVIEARLKLYSADRPYEEPLPTPWKP